jgi:hypothetical protein
LKVVPVWLPMNSPGWSVPKKTPCDMAPESAVQLSRA